LPKCLRGLAEFLDEGGAMKVFISWAGERSNAIAAALYKWLPAMQQKIEPYMSSESIEKGTLWFPDLTRELEATRFGVVVLTSENKDSPWLHFEAGVVARAVDQARLAPILFGLNPSDIGPPLTQFQVTSFEKADMKRLLASVNSFAGEESIPDAMLNTAFEITWPHLTSDIAPTIEKPKSEQPTLAATESANAKILEELLTLNRQQSQVLSNPERLFGSQILSLLVGLLQDREGSAVRLLANERQLLLALTARWDALVRELKAYLASLDETPSRSLIERRIGNFNNYLQELQQMAFKAVTAVRPDAVELAAARVDADARARDQSSSK
jgi:hypothetical protein